MQILFYDILQLSNAPESLISPALSEIYNDSPGTITLDKSRTFDVVGIGNTDATSVTVAGQAITLTDPSPYQDSYKNGLYSIPSQTSGTVTITHNGTFIGRIALGLGCFLGCSPSREPGFWTTNTSRRTTSGQIIPGAGGAHGRRQDVKVTYKITETIFREIEQAYPGQISRNFPFFIKFDKEESRMPWPRLYATIEGIEDFLFQSSVNKFLYSRDFSLREAF